MNKKNQKKVDKKMATKQKKQIKKGHLTTTMIKIVIKK